ncbi:hypothetical protein HOY80DRAFT_1052484 [Tuber brumale]|nr:hypothetical protein HOY80DRAFT_1052484 [Tuber brumale]
MNGRQTPENLRADKVVPQNYSSTSVMPTGTVLDKVVGTKRVPSPFGASTEGDENPWCASVHGAGDVGSITIHYIANVERIQNWASSGPGVD